MKLYLLTQNVNTGYDTYDSCIVAANFLEEARLIRPDGSDWTKNWANSWVVKPEQVTVKLIGTAVVGTKSGIVLASFNAG